MPAIEVVFVGSWFSGYAIGQGSCRSNSLELWNYYLEWDNKNNENSISTPTTPQLDAHILIKFTRN